MYDRLLLGSACQGQDQETKAHFRHEKNAKVSASKNVGKKLPYQYQTCICNGTCISIGISYNLQSCIDTAMNPWHIPVLISVEMYMFNTVWISPKRGIFWLLLFFLSSEKSSENFH